MPIKIEIDGQPIATLGPEDEVLNLGGGYTIHYHGDYSNRDVTMNNGTEDFLHSIPGINHPLTAEISNHKVKITVV